MTRCPFPLPTPLPAGLDHAPDAVDVVVVGAGLPGLAAATWLARSGASVLLVEAAHHAGAGTSGRAPGLVYRGIVEHPWRLAASLGDGGVADLYRLSEEGIALLEGFVPVQRRGLVWAAVEPDREPAELAASQQVLARLGVDAVPLSPDAADAHTGAQGLGPGMYVADEGWVEPAAAVDAFAAAARAAGAVLAGGCTVHTATPDGDRLAVVTSCGVVAAEAVVLAAESGLQALGGYFDDTIQPVREAAIVLDGDHPPTCGLRAGFGYTTARPLPDGRLLLAGCRWATPHLETGETDASVVAPRVRERLEATAARFFPHTGPVAAAWSWITAASCDGLPIVGPLPGDARRLVCAGFAGHEATLGLRAARAVVDGLLTGTAPGVPSAWSSHRFL
ncbi:MAG: FAD-binding oxidoreductase [Alphaproteobacteria bacterium]|nr:FAD-binding oxidoreductase [Alphaproteobacteria bacterium]